MLLHDKEFRLGALKWSYRALCDAPKGLLDDEDFLLRAEQILNLHADERVQWLPGVENYKRRVSRSDTTEDERQFRRKCMDFYSSVRERHAQ